METQSLRRWALKELLIWSAALAGGCLTFSFFEPLYDGARLAAAQAGFARLFDFDAGAAGVAQFDTRVSGASPPLRGTIAASQGLPSSTHKTIVLNANNYGHFHAVAEINGQQVEFMTDTGATYVALSYETAQKLGLAPQNMRFSGRSTTANGVARVASIEIDAIRVGDITVRGVQAVVAEPGRMTQNLLGMSFIKQLSGFELNGNTLTMKD
ncbi:MAG: TIGR02281 family clan AA aspartic protease [Rhodomicrobium sp.]